MPSSDRRAARRQEILAATRRLFDERGVRDAQIEDIAQAVGINRAIIYRHFSGKEELFAMALVGYLDELDAELARPPTSVRRPVRAARSRSCTRSSTSASSTRPSSTARWRCCAAAATS